MSSNATSATTKPYVYIYMAHGTVPKNVTHVTVHESVTEIPNSAFRKRRHLKEVVLPEGLLEIGYGAFHGCKSLEEINFPSTLEIIGGCAFYKCSSLMRVDFNEGLQTIGVSAFDTCQSILHLQIPFTVTTIGYEAFQYCDAMEDAQLCEGLLTIESRAFCCCSSLIGIRIPSSLTTIGRDAFSSCDLLRNVAIAPDSTLEQEALEQSHLLHNLHQVEHDVLHFTYMGYEIVPKNVTHVTVHESVTIIRHHAFQICQYLKELALPEGLQEISEGAFRKCKLLKEINFPSTLRVIEGASFWQCSSLVKVDFNEGLQTIGRHAFGECRSILRLKIPSTVTTIYGCAFVKCLALKNVQLCEGLQMIEDNAFSYCYSLLSINIPSSLTTIGHHAFSSCNFLRNVAIAPGSTLEQEELEQSGVLYNLDQVRRPLDSVKGRFNDLPLHRICFYDTSSATFLEEANESATEERLTQVDCLGMTPLHVLASLGKNDIDVEVFKFFVGGCPGALLIRNIWGDTPLDCAIWSEAPREIIHFLFEKHSKSLNGSLPFNFRTMVEKLAHKEGTSPEFLASIIQAQRTHFPNLQIEWERIVNGNYEGSMHVKMFGVLVEASVSNFNQMSSGHQKAIDNLINDLSEKYGKTKRVSRGQVRDLIVASVQQFVEATTMIELFLWQVAIHETIEIDNPEFRENCRVICKAEDIIPRVMSFL